MKPPRASRTAFPHASNAPLPEYSPQALECEEPPMTARQRRGSVTRSAEPAPRRASQASVRRSLALMSTSLSVRRLGEMPRTHDDILLEEEEARARERCSRWPWFSALAILGCVGVFVWEIGANGWLFQPFVCEQQCGFGACNADGTPCEANLLYGPKIAVMDALGAKNEAAIAERGEWWRVFTCNWLHAGLIHLVLNMVAVLNLGVPLEQRFGFVKIALLYLLSGIIGTMASVVFLPYVLSVGASASVFGLVGACWADVIINYCARCTLENSGFFSLLVLTLLNLCIGFTPYVDNFMHVGGFVSGIIIGCTLFSKKHTSESGRRRRTCLQREIVFVSALLLLALLGACVAAMLSPDVKQVFRSCTACEQLNCVEITLFTNKPWWSCCVAQAPGTCSLLENSSYISASCNMTGRAPFSEACAKTEPGCEFDPSNGVSINELCARLCDQCD